jgi:beta-phosphoglucomutase-like phosphatase (HAD superfamily)
MLGIEKCFQSVVDTDRFRRAKPDPEIFQVAMGDLGVRPAECWIIEDSLPGVRAGKAAGSFTVGITTTFRSEELVLAGADLVVESFTELQRVLSSK